MTCSASPPHTSSRDRHALAAATERAGQFTASRRERAPHGRPAHAPAATPREQHAAGPLRGGRNDLSTFCSTFSPKPAGRAARRPLRPARAPPASDADASNSVFTVTTPSSPARWHALHAARSTVRVVRVRDVQEGCACGREHGEALPASPGRAGLAEPLPVIGSGIAHIRTSLRLATPNRWSSVKISGRGRLVHERRASS